MKKFGQFADLKTISRGDHHRIVALLQLLNNWGEEWYVWRIIEVDPDVSVAARASAVQDCCHEILLEPRNQRAVLDLGGAGTRHDCGQHGLGEWTAHAIAAAFESPIGDLAGNPFHLAKL